MTVHTGFRLKDFGWVVSLFIESRGKGQNTPWAEFDAVTAPLATVLDDVNLAS
jgi:hypothetical protein